MKKREVLLAAILSAAMLQGFNVLTGALLAGNASTPTRTANYVAGTVIDPSVVNADINQLYSELQGNVGTANLLDNSITTAKIVNNNVTISKIGGNGNTNMFLRGDASWAAPASVVPTGTISIFAGSSAPTSWLICNGAAVSRTTYSGLFGVVSTTYGSGDGSTTFNIPDCTGRVVAGKEASATRLTATYFGAVSGQTGATLGAVGGLESHTLTAAQLAAHTHTYQERTATLNVCMTTPASTFYQTFTSQNSGSAGSGSAHQIVQPTIVLNYIIKY